jgi:hypothetical protein
MTRSGGERTRGGDRRRPGEQRCQVEQWAEDREVVVTEVGGLNNIELTKPPIAHGHASTAAARCRRSPRGTTPGADARRSASRSSSMELGRSLRPRCQPYLNWLAEGLHTFGSRPTTPRPRQALPPHRTVGRGPRRAGDGDRDAQGDGDGALAARGRAGAGRGALKARLPTLAQAHRPDLGRDVIASTAGAAAGAGGYRPARSRR